jgi:NADPH-dependent F420 reductase
MDIAVIGGTGQEGFGLALRLTAAGHHVTIGSRDPGRAADAAERVAMALGDGASVDGEENALAARNRPVVIVTVPFGGQVELYRGIAGSLAAGAVVVDATSPLQAAVGGKAWEVLRPWQGSAAELAATLVPEGVRLVGAFHTVAAAALQAHPEEVDEDVLVCGDDADAKLTVGLLVDGIPGMRWVDCGPLPMARITETLTPLLISINRRYKSKESGFRIVGRDTWGAPGGR